MNTYHANVSAQIILEYFSNGMHMNVSAQTTLGGTLSHKAGLTSSETGWLG